MWSMTALFAWASSPTDILAMAAVVAIAVAVLLAARLAGRLPAEPARVVVTPARARTRRAVAVRQLDPDAPGRPRPRAPGARFPAA
jgi:hypothetical protein